MSLSRITSYLKSQEVNTPRDILLPTAIEAVIAISCATTYHIYTDKNDLKWYNSPYMLSTVALIFSLLTRVHKYSNEINIKTARLLRASAFAFQDANIRQVILHEGGHALACLGLFKNPHPTINLQPLFKDIGGLTTCGTGQRATQLSFDTSSVLLSAAGAGTIQILALLGLVIAQVLPDKLSELTSYLRMISLFAIMMNATYAASAISLCDDAKFAGHDFCNIDNKLGVTPAENISLIIGTAFVLQGILSGVSLLHAKCKRRVEYVRDVEEGIELDNVVEANDESEGGLLVMR